MNSADSTHNHCRPEVRPFYRAELDRKAPIDSRIKKTPSKSYIQHQKAVSPPERGSEPKSISSKDRTVIEFSRFCRDFYSQKGNTSTEDPDNTDTKANHLYISDFCSFMRRIGHYDEEISHFNQITDVIQVYDSSDDYNRPILKKLIHSDNYNHVPGIEAAREALPIRKRTATREENSDIEASDCRRSARISCLTKQKDAQPTPSSDSEASESPLPSETKMPPIAVKRRRIKHLTRSEHENNKRERLLAFKQIIEVCLERPITKKSIEDTMKSIVASTDHWSDIGSLRTSLRRWFHAMKPEMTEGFTVKQTQAARKVFSSLIGFHNYLTKGP